MGLNNDLNVIVGGDPKSHWLSQGYTWSKEIWVWSWDGTTENISKRGVGKKKSYIELMEANINHKEETISKRDQ